MADEETGIEVQDNAPEERPEWLPDNFKSPEDLAQSWQHEQAKISQQGQEISELRQQLAEIQTAQHTQQAQVQTQDIEQQLYDAYESGDGRAIAAANAYLIQQSTDQLKRELQASQTDAQPNVSEIVAHYAEQTVAANHEDWSEMRAKVAEVIGKTPALANALSQEQSPTKVAEHLEAAYRLAKYEAGQTQVSKAEQTLAELNRQVKNQAQTMSGSNSSEEASDYWDKVKAARSGIPSIRLS